VYIAQSYIHILNHGTRSENRSRSSNMDVQRLVRTSITTGDLSPPQEFVDGINTGTTPLLDVVKALGEYLTTTEDDVRLKGEPSHPPLNTIH
jgi:hypothetical protein